MTGKNVYWYVVYTRPRWEKKVARLLDEKGVEAYCPLNKVYRQWSDRRKLVQEPLFKGYVFVHLEDEHKWDVKKIDGILNFVYWNGKPAVVRDEEIETIKKFLSEFSDVEVEDLKLAVQTPVRIKRGILMNYQGIVVEVMGNKAKVKIESMGVQLSAIFEKKNLEPA
ncbi:UpxY family transcription antiterminator [Flavisolibacter ginsenosidimutans]|uniref:UpxY family transcription antiterminator n=1 Tax=Flavisolibacter ginsenosidimutans TaxID=661481 RepID=A0A5B8UDT6_9BACT|nr:UpxY family transcription antiterminator [Flavisolibacter ginsenosidimutans]QEC54851.1 UpxY family transcription antiterminator [Flavisolibacter ginsenosidimutans]